ncbi:hypothetical protein [Aminiphilus sp.]|uniref:tetratricopeptide repeat protein n=1 Tax=Aminiphilus sp. TaxID=1872488 RepID=UPI00261D207D|nr:hypothetical protein [Aminiphilus sp.]
MAKKKASLEELLEAMYDEENPQKVENLASQILAVSPENPEALFMLADLTEDVEESVGFTERAVAELRRLVEKNPDDEELSLFLTEGLQRLGFAYIFDENGGKALETAEALLERGTEENDGAYWARAVRYIGLLQTGQYSTVLEEVLADSEKTPFSAHAQAIATLELAGSGRESHQALLEAFRVAPNLPFYLLDYWDAPDSDEDDEDTLLEFSAATLLHPVWVQTEERIMALSTATTFFGYLTDRLPEDVLEEIRTELAQTPVFPVLEMGRSQIEAACGGDDADWETLDQTALDILSRMEELSE